MKTLIINGSPRKNGDTVSFVNELKKYLPGEIIEISAYRDNIHPCVDCRRCWVDGVCCIKDDMEIIYNGDYDNVVLASPIYLSGFPGPFINLANRFQVYYAARKFAKKPIEVSPKKGVLILVGAGGGRPDRAIELTKWMFKKLGADYDEDFVVLSLNTDQVPAVEDEEAIKRIRRIGCNLSR